MKAEFNYYLPVYRNLEEEFINLSKDVQIDDDQLDVYSMHIADLLVRCAIEIEAISKELYWETGGVKVFNKNGDERNLYFDTDCISHLDRLWGICEKEIFISSEKIYLKKEENSCIRPLKKGNVRSGAEWNIAYQAVKHSRKENIKQGNIRNLISALGALYILNLYYLDSVIDLGITCSPADLFDSRRGSLLFSAATVDAVKDVKMGADPSDDIISNELKEKCKSAIFIIRYKKESWDSLNAAIREDKEEYMSAMKEGGKLEKYIQEHVDEFEDMNSKHILSLAHKVLGEDYIRRNHLGMNFGREFNRARKEAILNKNEPIY